MPKLTPREQRAVTRALEAFRGRTSWFTVSHAIKFAYVLYADEGLNPEQTAVLDDLRRLGWWSCSYEEYILGHGEWRVQ